MNDIATLIYKWLASQVDCHWLDQQLQKVASATNLQETLFTSIGLAPRKMGKADLKLNKTDMAEANALSPGWDPTEYSVDLASRLCLLLNASEHGAQFEDVFDLLWRTADVAEQVTFYRGLALYPNPERYLWRATDGCRTNIKGVFEAIAHRNPYPAQYFDEVAFNQLCLKALFVGSSLHRIHGIENRYNPTLARMMTDYAYERWAAGRSIYPELWRCVAPHPDERCKTALATALGHSDRVTRLASALACQQSANEAASALLKQHPEAEAELVEAEIDWVELEQLYHG